MKGLYWVKNRLLKVVSKITHWQRLLATGVDTVGAMIEFSNRVFWLESRIIVR